MCSHTTLKALGMNREHTVVLNVFPCCEVEMYMAEIFNGNQIYVLGDPELEIIGSRELLAQWRHRMVGPAWVSIGRKITYLGSDLNAWIAANRTDPNEKAV